MNRREIKRIRRLGDRLGIDISSEQSRSVQRQWTTRTWRVQLALFAGFLLPVSTFWIWLNFNMMRSGGGIIRLLLVMFVYISGPIAVFVISYKWILRSLTRKTMFQIIREHGFDICTNCGYRLSGNEALKCPECGTDNDPPGSLND